ncbi:hypothetical protein [Nonomuraea wenchangensis]|uniref:Uncharacterized protein n=1 Tax=Nonomuraea wenchangensis TaxID=568860 RepID=A0A1I0FNI0_9ACTN|nr:hypothetical protein [Nonomuraea wenchangensis]SET59643.1 hypothetical protein SAMN05421811_103540 [Nonomuraea wenchangensis]
MTSSYDPMRPARRPGGRPAAAPQYRVLVHRRYLQHFRQLEERVGLQQAQQFWDHVSQEPGKPSALASITILRGAAGRPRGPGWSRTHHYELTSKARVDYQYHDEYTTEAGADPHPVVAILTISFGSH